MWSKWRTRLSQHFLRVRDLARPQKANALMTTKCPHGYFTSEPCPWCSGRDLADFAEVVGHGNGWLLRLGDLVCPSCGGPRVAGWGLYVDEAPDPRNSDDWQPLCYACTIGENTVEAIARRDAHVSRRGVRKRRGSKEASMRNKDGD